MKTLFIVNKGYDKASLQRYAEKMQTYFSDKMPKKFKFEKIDVDIDYIDVDINVKIKSFGLNPQGIPFYGTENAKDEVRKLNIVPRGKYNAVFFCYKQPNVEVGAYVAPLVMWKGIHLETEWVEMPALHEQNAMEHELIHAMYNILKRQNIKVIDQMDKTFWDGKMIPYYKNNNPLALLGNYYFSLSGLQPHLLKLDGLLEKVKTIPTPKLPKVEIVKVEPNKEDYIVDLSIINGGFVQTPNIFGRTFNEPKIHIIHKTLASYKSAIGWLTDKRSEASYHILYKREGGSTLLAKPTQRTWHSGIKEYTRDFDKMSDMAQFLTKKFGKNPNLYSIGHGFVCAENETFTKAQYNDFFNFIDYMQKRYNWKNGVADLPETLMTHKEFVHYKPDLSKEKEYIINRARPKSKIELQLMIIKLTGIVISLLKKIISLKINKK